MQLATLLVFSTGALAQVNLNSGCTDVNDPKCKRASEAYCSQPENKYDSSCTGNDD